MINQLRAKQICGRFKVTVFILMLFMGFVAGIVFWVNPQVHRTAWVIVGLIGCVGAVSGLAILLNFNDNNNRFFHKALRDTVILDGKRIVQYYSDDTYIEQIIWKRLTKDRMIFRNQLYEQTEYYVCKELTSDQRHVFWLDFELQYFASEFMFEWYIKTFGELLILISRNAPSYEMASLSREWMRSILEVMFETQEWKDLIQKWYDNSGNSPAMIEGHVLHKLRSHFEEVGIKLVSVKFTPLWSTPKLDRKELSTGT